MRFLFGWRNTYYYLDNRHSRTFRKFVNIHRDRFDIRCDPVNTAENRRTHLLTTHLKIYKTLLEIDT